MESFNIPRPCPKWRVNAWHVHIHPYYCTVCTYKSLARLGRGHLQPASGYMIASLEPECHAQLIASYLSLNKATYPYLENVQEKTSVALKHSSNSQQYRSLNGWIHTNKPYISFGSQFLAELTTPWRSITHAFHSTICNMHIIVPYLRTCASQQKHAASSLRELEYDWQPESGDQQNHPKPSCHRSGQPHDPSFCSFAESCPWTRSG